MYSQDDLNAAVAAGAISPQAAADLRAFVAARRETPVAEEEDFRLLTGFNDIFVALAAGLTLVAAALLAGLATPLLSGVAVPALAWALAEYFTRRRRMALPSIVLMLAFVAGIGSWCGLIAGGMMPEAQRETGVVAFGLAGAGLAAFGHWRRFRVPITMAAMLACGLGALLYLGLALVPALQAAVLPLTFVAGCLLFAAALWWDASDPRRLTRRSDVALWLHLAAAPAMVHPLFAMLGDTEDSPARALVALALYLGFAVVALVIDRRALLVAALAYVLYATFGLFQAQGNETTALALTGLVIGTGLLMLSVWWARLRAPLVGLLPPGWRVRLPPA